MRVPPCISVVVPCFNAAPYVSATLRSVLGQDGVELDVIVVDDGSKDGSADLVAREFPEVRLIRQANQGVAAARNAGMAQARGDWIAFVDADDIWLPGKLRSQWELLTAQREARMCYTGWHVWPSLDPAPDDALVSRLQNAAEDLEGVSGWIYPQLLLSCEVWTSTVLAERSLFEEIGGFDPQLRIGEDLDLWLRASRVTPILRVPRALALYRIHPASITRRAPEKNYQAFVVERAIERWGLKSPDGSTARRADVDRALALTWHDFGGANLAAGHWQRARLGGVRAVAQDWRLLAGWKLLAKGLWRGLSSPGRSGATR